MGGLDKKAVDTSKPAPEKGEIPDLTRDRAQFGDERAASLASTSKEIPAGKLQELYAERLEKLDQKMREGDIDTLKNSEISDIRFNSRLLNKKTGEKTPEEKFTNIEEETQRRIAAYTEFKNGWHELNYAKMESDKNGLSHELHVGLGDILLDPDIKQIEIFQNGTSVKATRGNYKGRVAFLYENGKYAATYTGDKFKILDDKETDLKDEPSRENYFKSYQEEENLRSEGKPEFDNYMKSELGSLEVGPELNPGNNKGVSEEFIIRRLGEKGPELLAYAKEVCAKFLIPFSIFKELIMVESGWKADNWYKGPKNSNARGLGAFLGKTWNGFVNHCNANNIHDEKWGPVPLAKAIPERTPDPKDGRFNPFAMLYATAWLMNETKKTFPNLTTLAVDQQAIYYYLTHHEGAGGAKTFLRIMKSTGRTPAGKGDVLVLAKRIARRAADYEGISLVASNENETKPGESSDIKDNGKAYNFEKPIGKMVKYRVKVKSGQDQWLLGSSIAVGMDDPKNTRTGIIGMGGDSARSFLKALPRFWKEIEKSGVTPPKQIVLVGLQLNGLLNRALQKPNISPEANARAEMTDYMKITNFLAQKGVKNVRISTSHVWQNVDVGDYRNGHIEDVSDDIIAFNNILKNEHPEMCIDVSPVTGIAKRTDLHNFRDYKGMVRLYEKAIDKTNIS